jgi:hypothetical protein
MLRTAKGQLTAHTTELGRRRMLIVNVATRIEDTHHRVIHARRWIYGSAARTYIQRKKGISLSL